MSESDDVSGKPFQAIAEREFQLRGPTVRVVTVRIGIPEVDPDHTASSRCPYQVTGLSNDAVQYAHGVDSFQALNLAFAGIRNAVKTNATVLAAFHDNFSLTWAEESWDVVLPIWAHVADSDRLHRLERFLESLWTKKSTEDARFLAELEAEVGKPTRAERAQAKAVVGRITKRSRRSRRTRATRED